MSQNADLLVHIGPLREESEALLMHANLTTLIAPLTPIISGEQQALTQALPALYIADQPITSPGGEAVCYAYSLNDFNSLAPARELNSLYPGLGKALKQSIVTQTLPQALEQAGLIKSTLTHLILEQPETALSLLKAFNHIGSLDRLTHLWVRTSPLRLYDGMVTNAELAEWCKQQGFEAVTQDISDPDFFLLGFIRNPLYGQLKTQKAQTDSLEKKIGNLQEKLAVSEEKLAVSEEKLAVSEEEQAKYKRYFTSRKKQHEAVEKKLAEAQLVLNEKDAIIHQLNKQLLALQHSNERFTQMESKLESLFGEQRSYIQQTTSALGQHVTRSVRQQRDEQALTHYLQHGQRPVSTKLAPGYAMALLEHFDTLSHDVVVIFGSVDTTELMAQSIISARAVQPRLTQQNGQRQVSHSEITPSHDDLPQTIISIEHQKTVSDELKEHLTNKHLSQAVNVVYAPWVECQANGGTALFYAADATLQRLYQWLPEDARVMIIVGEALPVAGHSREVILQQLLQQLPSQQLDIVLEGNAFPQESDIVARWEALLETRQRPIQWLALPTTHSLRVG